MEIVRPIFHSFFEDTTVTENILKSRICNTSCIEIYTLFAIFNNKELRNFKGRPRIEWIMVFWKVISGMNAMKSVTQN